MKKHLILLGLVTGALMASAPAEEKHTPLEEHMEAMDDAFKGFRRETDAVKGATQARESQTQALKAAMEIPAMVKEMPAGPVKDKAAASYRKMMGKLFVTLCEVEEAFLNGKMEDVTKLVDTIKEQKKEGHDQFIEEEEEEEAE